MIDIRFRVIENRRVERTASKLTENLKNSIAKMKRLALLCYTLIVPGLHLVSCTPETSGLLKAEKPVAAPTPPIELRAPGDNAFIRPSAGEVVTAGTTYTVKWGPVVGAVVSLYVDGDYVRSYGGELCPGWIINPDCAMIGDTISNTGQFKWVIEDPLYSYSDEKIVNLRLVQQALVDVGDPDELRQ